MCLCRKPQNERAVLSCVFKIGSVDMMAEAKWLHEMESRKRLEGDTVWFKLIAWF